MIKSVCYEPREAQQPAIILGLVLIFLATITFANDLGRMSTSSRYDGTLRKTTNRDLEGQWRLPVSDEFIWRADKKRGATKSFDKFEIEDLDQYHGSSSIDDNLSDRNPTLFGLKLTF